LPRHYFLVNVLCWSAHASNRRKGCGGPNNSTFPWDPNLYEKPLAEEAKRRVPIVDVHRRVLSRQSVAHWNSERHITNVIQFTRWSKKFKWWIMALLRYYMDLYCASVRTISPSNFLFFEWAFSTATNISFPRFTPFFLAAALPLLEGWAFSLCWWVFVSLRYKANPIQAAVTHLFGTAPCGRQTRKKWLG